MKTHLAPVNQKKSLAKALKPYRRWEEWVRSPGCFLSPQDIGLITIYKQTGSYAACQQQLHMGIIESANRLIYLILRLKAFLPMYQEWEQGQKSLYEIVYFAEVKTVEDLKTVTLNEAIRIAECKSLEARSVNHHNIRSP